MKPSSVLPASVQERLSGWVRIQEQRGRIPAKASPGPTITLSRKYGCEGFPLALRLQELLGASGQGEWSLFDKTLIERVAEDEGISLGLLKGLGDPARALEAFGFHPLGQVSNDEAFAKVAETLVRIARQGNAIIVGRGGAILCRDLGNCFHFRLDAGFEWRVASLMGRMDIDRSEAERRVKTQSRLRDQFIKERLGQDVADRRHYDAVFNNERHSVDAIAAAIVAYVQNAWTSRG